MIKETFIIRTEWYEAIAELDPKDQATILRNLFAYHCDQDITLDTFGVKIVWKLIEPTLSRSADTYERKLIANRENGKRGGRPPKEEPKEISQENPKNQVVVLDITQEKEITLSDSHIDSESDIDYHSGSESDEIPTPTEKQKDLPEYILTAPGTSPAHDLYYEQEICMRYSFTREQVQDIHTAWIGDRLNHLFTLKEARLNFASYCAKWKQNNSMRGKPWSSTPPISTQKVEYSES